MERRALLQALGGLSAGAAGVLAGCVGHPGDKACLMVEATTPTTAAAELATPLSEVTDEVTVHLSRTITATFPDTQGETARVARAVLEDGSARTSGYRVLARTPFVTADEAFYEIEHEQTGQEAIEREVLVADVVDTAPGSTDLGTLDSPAREYVRAALEGARRFEAVAGAGEDAPREEALLERAELDQPPALADASAQLQAHHPFFAFVFREYAPDPSTLDLPAHVEHQRGDATDLARLVTETHPITELEFEYTGTHRGTRPEAFMEEVAPALADMSVNADQRAMFEEAIGDGFDPEAAENDIDMEAYVALIGVLDTTYVWFEDDLYRVEIEYGYEGTECF